jgi:hypothetical protein
MKAERDYSKDLADIRSMMERSTKFVSLSGWEGILAGMYALTGAYIANTIIGFNPDGITYSIPSESLNQLVYLGVGILLLSLITAIFFSWRKAGKKGVSSWNATSRRLLSSMAVPMGVGGVLIGILIAHGLLGLVAPMLLLFYGLALVNAGQFTVWEVKLLGAVQIVLGLFGAVHVEHGLLVWAIGFGAAHILYGITMHIRYER